MSRELTVLGTAGQISTRDRSAGGCALRWDGRLLLFDPGEGFQRQCLRAGIRVVRADGLFLSHLNGDHCLGLPGVLHRRILDGAEDRLPVYYPGASDETLDHLLSSNLYTERDIVERHPVEAGELGTVAGLRISACRLDHPVPTFAYRLDEPTATRLDGAKLAAVGIRGSAVRDLLDSGCVRVGANLHRLADFEVERRGQSVAYVLDSALCAQAIELADGVDLLVCEATYLDAEQRWARERGHMTAREAGWLAREAGVRRVVLTHFSGRYDDLRPFGDEAGQLHDDVVVATDLMRIAVPSRSE